jgi:pimeloyl-ACP methyl ester carboxylesterase
MLKKLLLSIPVILILVLLYIAFGRTNLVLTKQEVRKRYTLPVSKFINWKGNVIHYTDDGAGVPVLMIHGFGGSSRDFRYLDTPMSAHYRIIRVDLPGFGLSDFPKLSGKDPDYNKMYAEFFDYFFDTLHLDTLYVAGNSMGGMAAWDLAIEHPDKVKKLVLLSSAGYEMDKVVKVAAQIFRFNAARVFFNRGIPRSFTGMSIKKCFANPAIVTNDKVEVLNDLWNKQGSLDVFFDLATTTHFLDTSLIKKVQCPTLIIWGKEDKIIPVNHADRFHRDIKNSTEIIYSPCGHVPMVERPAEVGRDMMKFFEGN